MNRTHKAAQVFKEIMNAPDQGIPQDLLASAKCIAIIPGDVKFAFVFGGSYGRGLATCRTEHGWSAPIFVAIDGGSVGYQIGGSSTDIVMLFMNDHALQSLLSDKFKLGADASVAAGPVGRNRHRRHRPQTQCRDLVLFTSQGRFRRSEPGRRRDASR